MHKSLLRVREVQEAELVWAQLKTRAVGWQNNLEELREHCQRSAIFFNISQHADGKRRGSVST